MPLDLVQQIEAYLEALPQSEADAQRGSAFAGVRSGSGAPSANASFLGQIYIDTGVAKQAYIAVDVGQGASDWKAATA